MRPILKYNAVFILFFLSFFLASCQSHTSTTVAVTIRPLHSLVLSLLEGTNIDAELIIKKPTSVHGYNLKPSEARLIARSALIIRISRQLETYLRPGVTKTKIITLDAIDGLNLIKTRMGSFGQKFNDPHFWIDPDIMKTAMTFIAEKLIEKWPGYQRAIQTNLKRLNKKLTLEKRAAKAKISSDNFPNYLVDHNAYQYFEREMGLRHQASILNIPGHARGLQHMSKLRSMVTSQKIQCVFVEKQSSQKLYKTLLSGTDIKLIPVDLAGNDYAPGEKNYFLMWRGLVKKFASCRNQSET